MARKVPLGGREVDIGDLEAILSKETGEFFKRVGSLFGPWVASYSPHPWGRGVSQRRSQTRPRASRALATTFAPKLRHHPMPTAP